MRRFLTLAAIAMALFTAACSPRPVTKIVTFGLETSTLEQRTAVAHILAARFDGYRPSKSSPLETRVLDDAVVIQFRGEAPDDASLQTYGAAQGVFRVSPADAKHLVLISDLDIEDATSFTVDDGGALRMRLTEPAGARMTEFTRRNLGRVLVTTLDRKEISRAQVSGVFGREFQTTGLDLQLARDLGAVLRHGRLPVAVTGVHIKNLTE